MADTNFAFPSTLRKPETQTLGGSVIGSFALGRVFGELQAIFPIFCNGRHQFCVSIDTQKTGDPNFRGLVFGSFALGRVFGELQPFVLFSVMADTNFAISVNNQKTGDPNFRGLGNWKFCSRMHFLGSYGHFSHFL